MTPEQKAAMFVEDARNHALAAAAAANRAEAVGPKAVMVTTELVKLCADIGGVREEVRAARAQAVAFGRAAKLWGTLATAASVVAVGSVIAQAFIR